MSSVIDLVDVADQAATVRRTKELGPGIGRRLRQARELRNVTQVQLAKLAHTTQATVNTLERGDGGNSGVGLLFDLARALKVRPAWLVFGDGEPE